MTARAGDRRRRERGQGLVEFTLILPIVLLVVVAVAEFGLVFGDLLSVGYGSREGARVGSALARGDVLDCSGGSDPALVDAATVAAVQRILKAPGSGVDLADVVEVRLFKATSSGAAVPGYVNVWRYTGAGSGPEVDPGPGVLRLDFSPISTPWAACSRINDGPNPDSIGVTVVYRYRLVTPLGVVISLVGGSQAATITLTETTVMALNPSV